MDKVVPFLLPGRPGEYLVQVLGREEGVLASQSVEVSESSMCPAPNPLCVDPEVERLFAEAMEKASELVLLRADREAATALLEETAKEVELSYPGHGTERVARLRAMGERLLQEAQEARAVDNSLPARMLSEANTIRNDSLLSY